MVKLHSAQNLASLGNARHGIPGDANQYSSRDVMVLRSHLFCKNSIASQIGSSGRRLLRISSQNSRADEKRAFSNFVWLP